jgi:hypothetical protein
VQRANSSVNLLIRTAKEKVHLRLIVTAQIAKGKGTEQKDFLRCFVKEKRFSHRHECSSGARVQGPVKIYLVYAAPLSESSFESIESILI